MAALADGLRGHAAEVGEHDEDTPLRNADLVTPGMNLRQRRRDQLRANQQAMGQKAFQRERRIALGAGARGKTLTRSVVHRRLPYSSAGKGCRPISSSARP